MDSNTATVTINVTQPNRPPVITSAPVTVATQGVAYAYDVDATDPDVGDVLAYSFDTPSGMSINLNTGLIDWTPGAGQVGDHAVIVRVTDAGGLFATQSFTVTVVKPNAAPEITSTPVTAATAEQAYTYDVEATDPDAGDVLLYSLPVTVPTDMTIDPATGLIERTPAANQVGSHPVTVKVTDPGGLSVDQSFTITVAAVPMNHPPVAVDDAYDTTQAGQILLGFEDGQLPSAKGWTYGSDCTGQGGVSLPEGQAFSVASGLLHLDTAAPNTTFAGAFYEKLDVIDPAQTQLFEARLRVVAVEPAPPATTQVLSLSLVVDQHHLILQIGDEEVRTFDAGH